MSEPEPHRDRTILFHSSHLTVRGTEVALQDYATYNESLLGNRSVVAFPRAGVESAEAQARFETRFPTLIYDDQTELDRFAADEGVETAYFIKDGENDGVHVAGVRNVIHVVFKHCEPHGDVYAYISDWLRDEAADARFDFVPHIIRPPVNRDGEMRDALGIPADARVYGVLGGKSSFKSIRATTAILDVIEAGGDQHFLFVKTRMPAWFPWINARIRRALATGRLRYLDEISDFDTKERFINSCDVMIHARRRGESFGIALGEFAVRGKPLIVWDRKRAKDRCHYLILGDTANYFRSRRGLRRLLNMQPSDLKRTDRYAQFAPEPVMQRFKRVFLDH